MQNRPEVIIKIWQENAHTDMVRIDLDCLMCFNDSWIDVSQTPRRRFIGCQYCRKGIHGVYISDSWTIGFNYHPAYKEYSIYQWRGYWDFVANQKEDQ